MSISISGDYSFYNAAAQTASTSKSSKLESQLSNTLSNGFEGASDEELMDACKSFESYMVQQVMKQVKNAVAKSDDEEGEYVSYFGDMLYEQYANDIVESGELGIAQQLYESMKRNQ